MIFYHCYDYYSWPLSLLSWCFISILEAWSHLQLHSVLYCVSWWRHQMEIFSALLALCAGNSPVPVNSPHKGQWRGALMFSLICAWINDWINSREAGDLRRHRGHYDANVMFTVNVMQSAHHLALFCWVWYHQPFFVIWSEPFTHTLLPKIPPVRARYGVPFVGQDSDWYSTSVPAIIYAISYYIRPRYNDTRLCKIAGSGVSPSMTITVACPTVILSYHTTGCKVLGPIYETYSVTPLLSSENTIYIYIYIYISLWVH